MLVTKLNLAPTASPSLRRPFLSSWPSNCIVLKSLLPPLSVEAASDSGLLFREKLLYLQGLHVDPHKALRLNPSLRAAPISRIESVTRLLTSIGLSRASVGRILDMHPSLLTSDPNVVILPVIRFLLDEIPIRPSQLHKSLSRCPRLLVSSVALQLRPALHFLQSLGFVGLDAIDSRTTVLLVSSVEQTLIPKIECLEGLGFSKEEVSRMIVRSPGLLTFSVKNNLVPKVEYFLNEMSGELEELKRFPQYFSFSLEKKIKPRHRLLLEHGIFMPLSEMLKVSDGEFSAKLLDMRLSSVEKRSSQNSVKQRLYMISDVEKISRKLYDYVVVRV